MGEVGIGGARGDEGAAAGARLVGRDRELDELERALGLARREPVAVEIVGEPGIGKTRLLAELGRRSAEENRLVLEGRASEFERDVPFGVFVDALDDYLASLNPRLLEPLGEETIAELGRALPSLAGLAEGGVAAAGAQEERYRLHRGVRSLLALLAGRKPLVLCLDDLHWCDEASSELLSHLLRSPPPGPALIGFAYRTAQLPARLRGPLERAGREGAVARLEPQPLSEADAIALHGPELGAEECARVYREAGGNPFYLEELARASLRPGAPAVAAPQSGNGAGATPGIPPAVIAAIVAEVEDLSKLARGVLSGAAVVGYSFEPELAAAAADLEPRRALEALDELVERDLVRPTELPRVFRFRHPIVRQAVYQGGKPGWRLAAHARVAAALEAAGATPLARARHVECSAAPGDEAAVALLAAAGHEAAPRAPGDGAHWFAAALRLLGGAEPARRLELEIPMATAQGSAGRIAESRDTLRAVLADLPPELGPLRVQVIPFIALLEHLLGNHAAVPDLLERAMADLDEPRSTEGVVLQLELASDRFYLNDNEALYDRAKVAYEAARELSDPVLLTYAAGLFAVAAYKLGRLEEAEPLFEQARATAAELDDGALAGRLIALFWIGWYGQCAERFDEGIVALDRGLAISRASGQGYLLVPLLVAKSILLTWRGELAPAAELADDAIEIARLTLNDQSLAWALTLRCWIATLAGDLPHAIRCGEEAEGVAAGMSASYFSTLVGCYLGDARLEAGEPERCVEGILSAAGGPDLEPLERPYRPHFYDVLTRAELVRGRLDDARAWAERAECAVEGVPLPGRVAQARRARAAVLLAEGEPARAAEVALESVACWEERGNAVEAARTRTLAGSALAAAGDTEAATTELEAAEAALAARGAERHRDAAAAELRRLGRRVARRVRARPAGARAEELSPRELEIAQLVTEGMTNKQIAATLYVSEKTVEKHLSRVFTKLGVRKRAGVAAKLAERVGA